MDLLTSSNELKALCQRWIRDDDYITVDTEFVRTKTFYAQLCVIQVGCSKGAVAIDALAQKLDLTPFYEVLKSSKVIKVIHAGRQDLEIFIVVTHGTRGAWLWIEHFDRTHDLRVPDQRNGEQGLRRVAELCGQRPQRDVHHQSGRNGRL